MYLKRWNFSNLKLLKYLPASKIFICARNIYLRLHNIRKNSSRESTNNRTTETKEIGFETYTLRDSGLVG